MNCNGNKFFDLIPSPVVDPPVVEPKEIDGERILHDVMHIIVAYLEFNDLSNASKVCKSWREVALREKGKRFHIQQLNLPTNMVENLDAMVPMKPCASILFYEQQKHYNQSLIESMTTQSHKLISVHFDQCITSDEMNSNEVSQEQYYKVWSMFSPSLTEGVRVHAACCRSRKAVESYITIAKNLAESLGLREGEKRKSTILIFLNLGNPGGIHRLIVNELMRSFERNSSEIILFGPTSLWANCKNNEEDDRVVNEQCLAAVNIVGDNVDTWITRIHCSSSILDIRAKLRELKERVRPRRNCFGLFIGYVCNEIQCRHEAHPAGSSRTVMRMLKCHIPGVNFLATFRMRRAWPPAGTDDYQNDMLNRLNRDMTVAIITYD